MKNGSQEITKQTLKCNEITVVIVTYKRPQLLKNLLENLAAQELHPNKIYIIDNDDEGSAKTVVENTCSKYPGIPIEYQKNKTNSLTVGRNLGVAQVQTEFTCLLDDDVEIDSKYLMQSHSSLTELPNAVGVQGIIRSLNKSCIKNLIAKIVRQHYISSDNCRVMRSISTSYPKFDSNLETIECEWLSGSNQFYRTKTLKRFLWDEQMIAYCDGEDLDHSYRIFQSKEGKLYLDRRIIVNHSASKMGRNLGYSAILMRETYAYYLSHKLFGDKFSAKIIYWWSRLMNALVLLTKLLFHRFAFSDRVNLKNYFKAVIKTLTLHPELANQNLTTANLIIQKESKNELERLKLYL